MSDSSTAADAARTAALAAKEALERLAAPAPEKELLPTAVHAGTPTVEDHARSIAPSIEPERTDLESRVAALERHMPMLERLARQLGMTGDTPG